ncbi:hypothetical protein LLEC1_02443 [Akanthomyces lecanii]|uniref:Prion-inhibition and propagation HeLo domain-containing protein n=1 Tax=Cordyceps confragosa TaxID=2714763 RepID=A0A179ILE4_CORDF|nr:hypothetical protein LLEC1_02443 [Akanthomyces lecanii]
MAEVFGTISAALSVAALFNNAVQCFGYVQLGRHYGRDYERCQLKLDILQARLIKWGDTVGIHDDVRFATASPTDEATRRVRIVLEEIGLMFQTAKKTSSRYEITNQVSTAAWPSLDIFQGVLRKRGKERQRASSFKQKMKWALYDAKELQRLLTNMNGFVDDLEKLHPAEQRRGAATPDAHDALSETTTAVDEESRRGSAKSDDTMVIAVAENVFIDEKAKVRVGHEYSATIQAETLAARPAMAKARKIEAKGTSRVHVGNSYGFGSIFDD